MSALDDLVSDKLDKALVQRRVDDWANRLADLLSDAVEWLPPGWSVSRREKISMHEELMQRHKVSSTLVPSLTLTDEAGREAGLTPRGLWIIGANGRVDFHAPNGDYVIVDRAENFEPPNWEIAPRDRRERRASFDRTTFRDALA